MRNKNRIDLKWVRGNDVLLRALLYEPQTNSAGEAVLDRKGEPVWIPMDLDSYDDISAGLKLMGDTTTSDKNGCCCEDTESNSPAYYSVVSHKSTYNGILLVDIPGTLPIGIYSLEIIGHKNNRAVRAYEGNLFEIVECNGKANVTFDVQEGQKSADVDIKVQLVTSGVSQGKNAYELWRELPGNENGTLQDFLDGIGTGEVYQSDWNVDNANSPAYIKNKPEVYTKSEVDTRINNVTGNTGYQKPASGIPYSDLSSSVQSALSRANSALQNLSGYSASDVNALSTSTKFQSGEEFTTVSNGKVYFKTINNIPIVGSGNITVEGNNIVTSGSKLYYMHINRGSYYLYDETGNRPAFNNLVASNDYCGYLTFNNRMYRLSYMDSTTLKYDFFNLDPETHMLTKETFTIIKTSGDTVNYSIAYTTYGIEIPLITFDSSTQTLNINGEGGNSGVLTGYYTVTIVTTSGISLTEPVVSENSSYVTTVPAGTSMALKFNIASGYHMSSLLVNDANKTADIANNTYRLNNITEDTVVNFACEVDVTAGEIFTVTINPGTGGSVTFSSNGVSVDITENSRRSVYGGENFTITANADEGYIDSNIVISGNYDSRTDNGGVITIVGVRGNISVTVNFVSDPDYIDPSVFANTYNINAVNLGLQSGVMWGDRNLGAASITDEGEYFGWGDPTGEETSTNIAMYAPNNTDTCISMTEYDIVQAKLGGCWRLPTFEDYVELYMNTQKSYNSSYGDKEYGAWILEANGNSIAFIIAGYKRTSDNRVFYAGNDTWMWTGDAVDGTVSTDVHLVGACTSNLEHDVVRYLQSGNRSSKAAHISVRPVWDPNYVPRANKPVVNVNSKDYVDLGLYHGRLWATMNVGASSPEQYGNYYAWGETSTKVSYSLESYAYKTEGATDPMASASYQNIGNNISGTEYDVAKQNWGGDWRMPNSDAIAELVRECTWSEAEYNGVLGYTVEGPNGRSIFIPFNGMRNGETLYFNGENLRLWSGTLGWSKPYNARGLALFASTSQGCFWGQYERDLGYGIRPVIGRESGAVPSYVFMPDDNEAVDLGLTSGTLWAQHDLGGSYYYSWGEMEPKELYSFYNYGHRVADTTSHTTDANYTDLGNDIADTSNDVVKEKWANGWTMPTEAQMQELIDECDWSWSGSNILVTSRVNGNSIMLYDDGYMKGWQAVGDNSDVYYWTSTRSHWEAQGGTVYQENAKAICLKVAYTSSSSGTSAPTPQLASEYRYCGMKIRPVITGNDNA